MEHQGFPQKKPVEAEMGPVMEKKSEEVNNAVEKLAGVYYAAGVVTKASRFARTEENPEGRERPFFMRTHRAELYKKGLKPEDREKAIAEAHLRDAVAEQYLNQRELKLKFPEYGELSALMTDMRPPEQLRTPENEKLPPIFLMPGIANDIEVVNNMACEIVMQGRRCVVLAQPESIKGHTTPEFVEAVKEAPTFEPHAAFFGEAFRHIFKDDEAIELWGFSTGGAIAAVMLKDPEIQKKVKNAVLVAPAGFVKQSSLSLNLGLVNDMGIFKKKTSANFIMGYGFEQTEDFKRHEEIMKALQEKIRQANNNWKDARVAPGGSILVVSGGKDKVTRTARMGNDFKLNPQMRVLELPDAYHMSPVLDAETIVPEIMRQQ